MASHSKINFAKTPHEVIKDILETKHTFPDSANEINTNKVGIGVRLADMPKLKHGHLVSTKINQ